VTYFAVLLTLVVPPLVLLIAGRVIRLWQDRHRGTLRWQPLLIVLLHALLALVYTMPWDNYLVASGVWWYDETLVTGLSIGYIPIEEVIFFILQTLLTGLWTLLLLDTLPHALDGDVGGDGRPRHFVASAMVMTIWAASAAIVTAGRQPMRYAALILAWALIPILIQVTFGADLLWRSRAVIALAVLPTTLYLWLVDALAIRSGTWTIDPAQTTGLALGPLPVEEMLFFFMTNLIIACGITLMLSPAARTRAASIASRWPRRQSAGEG
jgi:lycopene cyclase domain-containing protein